MQPVSRMAPGDRLRRLQLDVMGCGLNWYLKGVEASTRWLVDDGAAPPWAPDEPIIALTWHGRQFLGHVALRKHERRSLLVAPHGDGQLVGNAAGRIGFQVITGSGTDDPSKSIRKRGAAAFRSILSSLEQRRAVLMTADVPKIARVAGAGAVKLAQHSGAPIHCFVAATSSRIELRNWDRTQIVMPFGRGAIIWSKAIHVPRHATPAEIEAIRLEVESTLNALHARADAMLRPNQPAATTAAQPAKTRAPFRLGLW